MNDIASLNKAAIAALNRGAMAELESIAKQLVQIDEKHADGWFFLSLTAMARKIVPGGVFGLWSNDLPDADFVAHLEPIFDEVEAHIVRFANPYSGGESTNSVYIASVK